MIHEDFKGIKDYRNAVFSEMYYLRDNGGRKYKVSNGILMDSDEDLYCYSFELETELHLADDSSVSVITTDVEAQGYVILCEDFQIIVVINAPLGKKVSSAMISVEPWKLLESLGNKIDRLDRRSKIAYKLVNKGPYLATNDDVSMIPKGQDAAIKHEHDNEITVIWGPPGTGKTYTMSSIAIDALKHGKTVLIVSHSNISVDGVIKAIAQRMPEEDLEDEMHQGKVLRYGYVRDDELFGNRYVVAYNYALAKNADIKNEMDELNRVRNELLERQDLSKRRAHVEEKLKELRKKIRAAERFYASHAQILATTISKVTMDGMFDEDKVGHDVHYDIVMFDEASMAYIPQVVLASSYAREHFVCVGDFRQLAPIAQSEARNTLCTDIFSFLGIDDSVGRIHPHPWLVMLNEQRRMHPIISDFPNKYVYNKLLENHESTLHGMDSIVEKKPLADIAMQLINLSGTYCAASKNIDNSRFNILSAILALGTAVTSEKNGEDSVGIITPYSVQVRLIHAMVIDEKADISCATVHQFQGSERNAIVFDAVESYPSKKLGILLSKDSDSVMRLINVALTRARGKFVMLANARFWGTKCDGKVNMVNELTKYMIRNKYITSNAKGNLRDYVTNLDYGKCIHLYEQGDDIKERLKEDVDYATNRIIISLPEGKRGKDSYVFPLLDRARRRGIRVYGKAKDYDSLPERWKKISCSSENAIFPLIAIDDSVIWYGIPDFEGVFKDGNTGYLTTLPLAFRISGKNAIEMISSLTDIDYSETDGIKTRLDGISQEQNRIAGKSEHGKVGLSEYIRENVVCEKCGQPMVLTKSFKSGKAYLKCSTCRNIAYLTKDEVNAYIHEKKVTCPQHHCGIHAGLGKFGIYVKCDQGHYLKPDEI